MTRVIARLRRRLTFANVTSGLALFVALGGTSYAAIALPDNSVGSSQIRRDAVGRSEIRPNGVRKWEIAHDAVGRSEILPSAVRAWEIRHDAVGPSELRRDAVRTDEIAKDAVTTDQIKDGSVNMNKLDEATRAAIASGAFRATVNKAGAAAGGNAKAVGKTAEGAYTVDFGADVTKCTTVATLSKVGDDTPDAGMITVAPGATANTVDVRTFKPVTPAQPTDPNTVAADEPFTIVASC
jgi:hypothetical protein